MLKRIYVALDEGVNVYLQSKFSIYYSRIIENHGKTAEYPFLPIDLDVTTFIPINLSLNFWFYLVAVYRKNSYLRHDFIH